jgi:hypothetical protein
MAHYAITMADGSVAIMQTMPQMIVGKDGKVTTVEPTPEECLAKWPDSERAKIAGPLSAIDPAVIPQDRTFRNAWTLTGDSIEHDMTKARDILRDRLRAARAPLLAELDIAYQRADEAGDATAKAAVAAEKQALRDVTDDPSIEAAATVADLKAITLETLAPAAVAGAATAEIVA